MKKYFIVNSLTNFNYSGYIYNDFQFFRKFYGNSHFHYNYFQNSLII